MATNNLELSKWGDGTTRLTLWDSLHGDDQIYVLLDNGDALLCQDDGLRTSVNLVAELRALAQEWADRATAWGLFVRVCALHRLWAWSCTQ